MLEGRGAPLHVGGGVPQLNGLIPDPERQQLLDAAKGYGWPKFGHNAEIRSLQVHARLHTMVENVCMTSTVKNQVMQAMLDRYQHTRRDPPPDFLQRSHFDRALASIEMSSSPGLPYCATYPVNRDMFTKNGEWKTDVVEWAWAKVQERLSTHQSDPIRLFVKPEPLKQAKLDEGRYRLIASVSVIDQLIDQMIFGWQNQLFIDNWIHLPTKVGWSPMSGGWKLLQKDMRVAIDKKAWDWTVKAWMIEFELEFRSHLAQSALFTEAARWRYEQLYREAKFVTSAGFVLKQNSIGIVKSGCVNTIVTNSILQNLLHYRVCAELDFDEGRLWIMGDDTLQTMPANLEQYMAQLRLYCLAKDPVLNREFAGFTFDNYYVEPNYHAKHAYNLLHFDPKLQVEMVTAYSLLYARSESDFGKLVMSSLKSLGNLPTKQFLNTVWNGEE